MPNWCANHLACSGPRDAVTSFLGVATQRGTFVSEVLEAAETIDPTHAGNITRAVLESFPGNENFSFNGHVPEPELEGDGWYDWRISNWGTKWDAKDSTLEELTLSDDADSKTVFAFETAWGPPYVWLDAVVKAHPNLRFQMVWNEEQGYGGIFQGANGELVHQDLQWSELLEHWQDAPYPPFHDDDEDADEEADDTGVPQTPGSGAVPLAMGPVVPQNGAAINANDIMRSIISDLKL